MRLHIAEMHRLIEQDPRNQERIFPYIGGEEVNTSPTHSHHRYVINFGDMKEDEARKYPDLMAIVEEKVKPNRLKQGSIVNPARWRMFARSAEALYKAIAQCDRVLVITAAATKYLNFVFLPSKMVFSHKLIVFPLDQYSHFASIQSRIHEIWVRFFSATMKDDCTYNPSDCFETFPFPSDWETNPTLEAAGKTYYEFRAALMMRHNQGLTATYNRFHDPDETNPDILKLRSLHAECDRAVLDAYGWTDIAIDCEFRLDYEDDDDEGTSKRKNPWRYRWSETVHDEVLARLLKLNSDRATAEIQGKTNRRKEPARMPTANAIDTVPPTPKQLDLIPPDTQQLDLL
ncbi:type IIL restriction-modification enzyme MmeI [Phormidesmis priestleyi]|uniref:type IIL restriction-modification enzyme MmeI n=1 Tax=Phormidesmis priestleyi TaxID=268141 RepID=UPI001FD356D8|nr:type IIL restriction-modification enzyme MmeI [Phormidesmis priestleyi]